MKKILKSPIFTFILGGILFSCIAVHAANVIHSEDVSFTPENSDWNVSTVKEAIDDLYPYKVESITSKFYIEREGVSSVNLSGFEVGDYYFCVTNMRRNVTTSNITGAEVFFSNFRIGFLDGGYSNNRSYIRATSDTINFSFPGAYGVGIECFHINK